MTILEHMITEEFEEILCVNDRRSGLRAFLAIHDTCAGPAFGGVRIWSYRSEQDAFRDAMRLARAMTYKCALAGIRGGGGKIVILDHEDLDREAAYRHLGRVIENLGGRYYAGPDVGTTDDDLRALSRGTQYCVQPDRPGHDDLAGATARGVIHGMEACLRHLDDEVDWSTQHVAIQGLGEVGIRIAKTLIDRGARVSATDIDEDRLDRLAETHVFERVEPDRIYSIPCDVFAPCAMGGVIHDVTASRLNARIVAGSANNVLAKDEHGWAIHQRGIIYAPDVVINAGALIQGATVHLEGTTDNELRVATIGKEVGAILLEADREGAPTHLVALEEARRRVDRQREHGEPFFPASPES